MIREIWQALKRWWSAPLDKIEALDLTPRHPGGVAARVNLEGGDMGRGPAPEYAVTGSPRHIPWSRRKKELEAAARQKRRQLESFREEA